MEGVPPPVGGGSGGLPRENFEKMMQNGAIWDANKGFQTHLNLAESLVKLHKKYTLQCQCRIQKLGSLQVVYQSWSGVSA